MNHETIRVSLAFARATDHVVEGTGYTVLSKLYAVPELANPPIAAAVLEDSCRAFTDSLAEMVNGGKLATSRKNDCRQTLVSQLRELAAFVQMKMKNEMTVLLASGFQPVTSNRTRSPLPQPVVLRVENGMSGQMILAAQAEANVKSWQVESALTAEDGSLGAWTLGDPATDSRRISVENLIPGRVYAFRLRAIGGTNGFSDWSDPITRRAA